MRLLCFLFPNLKNGLLVFRFQPNFSNHSCAERESLHAFRCIQFIVQRLNDILSRFIITGFLMATTVIPICANCAAVTATAKSTILLMVRKMNLTLFSLISLSFSHTFCSFTGDFSNSGNGIVKQWKLHSGNAYRRKMFRSIPKLSIRAGSFLRISKFTSMKIFISVSKYTAKLLINIMKNRH